MIKALFALLILVILVTLAVSERNALWDAVGDLQSSEFNPDTDYPEEMELPPTWEVIPL